MKNSKLSKLFEKRWFNILLSVVIAFIVWAIVAFNVSPETTRHITDIPVNLNVPTAAFHSLGLEIVDEGEFTVTVEVSGERNVIGSLTKDDITVTPTFTAVNQAGTYKLKLVATKNNSLKVYNIISIAPESITLDFDIAATKKLTVEPSIEGLDVADGFLVGSITATPQEITIRGPESELAKISRASAFVTLNGDPLTATTVVTSDIVLIGESGEIQPTDNLVLSSDTADITIPVYKKGILNLEIGFINEPDGFDTSTLDYVMSNSSIPVAAAEATIDNLSDKIVGYVDLADFEIGKTYTFELELPSGIVNLDNIATVTVTFPKEGLATRSIKVDDIRFDNLPSNYDIEILTDTINNVTLIGPSDRIDNMLSGSVIAVIDINEINIDKGEFSVPVRFVIPSDSTVWVSGKYSALISVQPK